MSRRSFYLLFQELNFLWLEDQNFNFRVHNLGPSNIFNTLAPKVLFLGKMREVRAFGSNSLILLFKLFSNRVFSLYRGRWLNFVLN